MKSLIFSTGNEHKFLIGQSVCNQYNITLIQEDTDVDEIQSEDSERIAVEKAKSAYAMIKQPVLISDDSWSFVGLKGFPGAYMHSMNEWFTPEDFLRLTAHLTDRAVLLIKYLVYFDGETPHVFSDTCKGTLLTEARGTARHACHPVICMDGDDGMSVAEVFASDTTLHDREASKVWHDFATWYGSATKRSGN